MSSTSVKDSNTAENPTHSSGIVISFQFVCTMVMSIKSEFLKSILLFLLGEGKDPLVLLSVFDFSANFLLKQKAEEDKFMERVKAGDVSLEELIEFHQSRINAIYCLSCKEEITKDNKIIECDSCKYIFHAQCFRKESTNDKCRACKILSTVCA